MKNDPLWYKDAVFYEVFVRAFADGNADGIGDLRGLTSRLDYLLDLGIDTLWLLPITDSPLRDDGYDVSDYYNIHPDYGTLADFHKLVEEAHHRGLRIVVELIPNHTSDQNRWFQASRDPNHPEHERYRDWYVWSKSDQKYEEARIIFLDYEKSNWTYDSLRGEYYWHRFFHHQPDLNYDHPEVQREMLKVIQFWIDQGTDGIRVDAPPYLYMREGTNCENLPETHAYFKRLRAFVDAYAPGTMLLSEANQWPEDVRQYFGDGDEFHMNFHFPLMPRIFMAMRKQDTSPLTYILDRTPAIPENCQWCTFLRNHDELTLEMVTEGERQWMWREYAPESRMRLNLGIRRRLAPLLDNDQRKIELATSLLFTLPGSPVIYYGDEVGMGDNIWLEDRDGVRTPMQWDEGPNAGFSGAKQERLYSPVIADDQYGPGKVNVKEQRSNPDSLWNAIKRMIAMRKGQPAFGHGDFIWVEVGMKSVAAYIRTFQDRRVLILNNLSDKPQVIEDILPGELKNKPIDMLSGKTVGNIIDGKFSIKLEAFKYVWLNLNEPRDK